MSGQQPGRSSKGKYRCPKCGKDFVAVAAQTVQCHKCSVHAVPVCRRCNHARVWASPSLQLCRSCVDFALLQSSGGLTSTPTGRLSDRPSRAKHWTGKSDSAGAIPRKRSRFSDAENHPRVTAYAHDMRNAPTPAEAKLAELLSRLLPNQGQVERQWAFGEGSKRFILDLFIPKVRLGIEVDGAHHGTPLQKRIDRAKESVAKAHRITICRISNQKCLSSSDDELTEWLREAWVRASKAQRSWRT